MFEEKIEQMARELALRIKKSRLQKKLTSEETAEKIGVSVRTYSDIEKGLLRVSFGTVLKALYILDVDLKEVVKNKEEIEKSRVKKTTRIDDSEVDF